MFKVFIVSWERIVVGVCFFLNDYKYQFLKAVVSFQVLWKRRIRSPKWTISGKNCRFVLWHGIQSVPMKYVPPLHPNHPAPHRPLMRSHSWQCMVLTVPLVLFCLFVCLFGLLSVFSNCTWLINYDEEQGNIVIYVNTSKTEDHLHRSALFCLFFPLLLCPKKEKPHTVNKF